MKQCPFCAEEIQDAAVICRFCQRTVKKNYIWLAIKIVILLVVVVYAMQSWSKIEKFKLDVARNFKAVVEIVRVTVLEIKETLSAIKDIKDATQSMSRSENITVQ